LYSVRKRAQEITRLYNAYPSSPRGFEGWQRSRDAVMDDLYELVGTDPKY
jgi:electron-transferring-flavoprotein dehydrogenase